MIIRRVDVDDAWELSRLTLSATQALRKIDFTEEGWQIFVNANTSDAFLKRLRHPNFAFFCCISSNTMLGFIAIKDRVKIDNLFVDPNEQKKGIATCLWRTAKKNAIANGSSQNFWVRSSSIAVPFYKRMGFEQEGNPKTLNGIQFQLMLSKNRFN